MIHTPPFQAKRQLKLVAHKTETYQRSPVSVPVADFQGRNKLSQGNYKEIEVEKKLELLK